MVGSICKAKGLIAAWVFVAASVFVALIAAPLVMAAATCVGLMAADGAPVSVQSAVFRLHVNCGVLRTLASR
eukprot:3271670-Prymnesium_polylepis.1